MSQIPEVNCWEYSRKSVIDKCFSKETVEEIITSFVSLSLSPYPAVFSLSLSIWASINL